MSWTSIATSTTTYTKVTQQGTQTFDDPSLTYDDLNNYYDSTNVNLYTNVASVITSWTNV